MAYTRYQNLNHTAILEVPKAYRVTRHAVERMRERILPYWTAWTDTEIRNFIKDTMREQPSWVCIAKELTNLKSKPTSRYYTEMVVEGHKAYVITDSSGFIALTVISEEMFQRWTILARAKATPNQAPKKSDTRIARARRQWRVE